MAPKKTWSVEDYAAEGREFVACYGRDYDWEEFVYEYVTSWDDPRTRAPNGDILMNAIQAARREVAPPPSERKVKS